MKVSASIAPDSCRLFCGAAVVFCVVSSIPFAIQGIMRKRVCRGIVLLFFLYPAVAIQVFLLERVCRCTEPQKERRFPSAIQVISRKRVCRCIVSLLFLYPAVALQVFPLEMVCRCTEPQKERRFLFAIREILRKRVYRCTEPLHRTSARTLCSEPRHGLKGKLRFAVGGGCSELFLKSAPWMNLMNGHMRIGQASDAFLMREVALGRRDALKVIMDRYMTMVSRTAYRIMCDRPDSEDITREVFIMVWRNASSYDGRYSVSTWLYGITCNFCLKRLRRRRIMELFSIRPSVYESSAPAAMSPEEDFITKETWAIFCRASLELSPRQRIVFTLLDLEGLSAEEVISITGMTTDEVKDNLHIARKKIRQELERYGKVR